MSEVWVMINPDVQFLSLMWTCETGETNLSAPNVLIYRHMITITDILVQQRKKI